MSCQSLKGHETHVPILSSHSLNQVCSPSVQSELWVSPTRLSFRRWLTFNVATTRTKISAVTKIGTTFQPFLMTWAVWLGTPQSWDYPAVLWCTYGHARWRIMQQANLMVFWSPDVHCIQGPPKERLKHRKKTKIKKSHRFNGHKIELVGKTSVWLWWFSNQLRKKWSQKLSFGKKKYDFQSRGRCF